MAQWLSYLESIHPSAIDLGLARLKEVAVRLNLDFSSQTVITVAGTNGKGTTCAMLEQLLLAQGKSVGVYASPHLIDYRERVRINGQMQPSQEFIKAFEHIESVRQSTTLTYFEFGTLAALRMFQHQGPPLDVIILEVGLGGRLDATNIIDPDIAVITSIALDHQDWLGDTREAIGAEKAGIMRQDGLAIIGDLEPPQSLFEAVTRLSAKALWAARDFNLTETDIGWYWHCDDTMLGPFHATQIVRQNAATALATLYQLNMLPANDVLQAIVPEVSLPGRRQIISQQPMVALDVAHNPHGALSLVQWLKQQSYTKLHLVVGMLADKSLADTLAPFACLHPQWYVADTKGPRGLDARRLAAVIESDRLYTYDSVAKAYLAAKEEAEPEDMIFVFGSFLTVADVLALGSNEEPNS
jgi:dihydrofolate synthase/folylpolyglutamate synthase